jgi:hypothetical protein
VRSTATRPNRLGFYLTDSCAARLCALGYFLTLDCGGCRCYRGDGASIYSDSFELDSAPPAAAKRGPAGWLKKKLKKGQPDEEQQMPPVGAAMERFGSSLSGEGGWSFVSLRWPDTADSNRAARAHVLVLAAVLIVGEISPLFLSMPGASPTFDVSVTAADGSYASELLDDTSTTAAATSSDGPDIGLGLDVSAVAIVGVLMSLCTVVIRRSIGQKVEVSSPFVALRFAGCVVVAVALISPALNRVGSNRVSVYFAITCVDKQLAAHTSHRDFDYYFCKLGV